MTLSDKKQVRSSILYYRDRFSHADSANLAIIRRFEHYIYPILQPKDIIAAYYPTGSEFDMRQILKFLSAKSFNVLLSATNKLGEMSFYSWKLGDQLIASQYNNKIFEPPLYENNQKKDSIIPSVIIAPLVGCDLKGNRLGSGKGMYDQYLSNLKQDALYIGLCYDFQLLDSVPTEPHDKALDIILTDKRFINKSKLGYSY